MTPLLDVQNISKAFGAHVLFKNISFSIGEGQHVGLIAKNGTGKSTLLSLLSGKGQLRLGKHHLPSRHPRGILRAVAGIRP